MKVGVLGGGLAGLTVAAHLAGEREGNQCEVLECDERPGGHCQSVQEEGFTYDAGGPHIIFSRDQKTLDYMLSLLGKNVYRGQRNNKILYKGRYVKYPFENGLYDLDPNERFECLYHYLYNRHPSPTNFREWLYHSFGAGLTEKYLLPYNEKIWNVPADQMAIDWVEGRVPKPPVEDVIKAAVGVETEGYTHQLHFYYPERGGIESLPRSMAERVPKIVTGFQIRHVRKLRGKWLVSDGRVERSYERLVSTIPIHTLANVLEDVPVDVKSAVQALRYNSLLTVTVGAASDRVAGYTAVYVPDPALLFHRLSFPALFSPANAPQGTSLIQAEITANSGDGVWDLPDSEVLQRVLSDLESLDLLRRPKICYAKVIRTQYGYVVRDFTYRSHLDRARAYFEGLGIQLCGRVAEFEYINMDQCIERAIRVATQVRESEAAREPECPELQLR